MFLVNEDACNPCDCEQLKQLIYFNNDIFISDHVLLYFGLNSYNNIMITNKLHLYLAGFMYLAIISVVLF